MLQYYNANYILRDKSMKICSALLDQGYSDFSLTILEICKKDDYDNLVAR